MNMYVLNEAGQPVSATQLEWGEFMVSANRMICRDEFGDITVSTVFLGVDHNYGDGPPLLFETMIFGGEHDQYQERYSTRLQAVEGHDRAVAIAKGQERDDETQ